MTYNVFGGTSNLALSIYLVDSYSPTVDLMYRKSVKFILTKSPCTAHRVPLCAWWIETTPTPSTLRRAPPSHFWSSSIKFILKGSAVDQSSSSAHLSGHTVGWLVDATRESGVDIEHVNWPQRGVVYIQSIKFMLTTMATGFLYDIIDEDRVAVASWQSSPPHSAYFYSFLVATRQTMAGVRFYTTRV